MKNSLQSFLLRQEKKKSEITLAGLILHGSVITDTQVEERESRDGNKFVTTETRIKSDSEIYYLKQTFDADKPEEFMGFEANDELYISVKRIFLGNQKEGSKENPVYVERNIISEFTVLRNIVLQPTPKQKAGSAA